MIYLDNSATTNPKPASVQRAAANAVKIYSFNSGRGGYSQSVMTSQQIFDTRNKIYEMTGFEPQNIAFTSNCTQALNMAIKGSIKQGSHIIISNLEHNAVSRPVETLRRKGIISYDIAEYDYDDAKTVNNFKKLIKPSTSVIVCTMASNVFGCRFPIRGIGKLAKENGIRMIVDGAQGVGVFKINKDEDYVDILCCPGHKGLYGPLGTGFIAVGDDIELDTIIEGGTGSSSLDLSQPSFLPDRLESGTLNNSGIIGLGAGIDFVNSKGIEKIHSYELSLMDYVYTHLSKNQKVTLYTPPPFEYETSPIVSFNYDDYSSEKTAGILADKGICVRGGLHCAPLAHSAFSTSDRGTVRVSPSVFTTRRECEIFINYLKKL